MILHWSTGGINHISSEISREVRLASNQLTCPACLGWCRTHLVNLPDTPMCPDLLQKSSLTCSSKIKKQKEHILLPVTGEPGNWETGQLAADNRRSAITRSLNKQPSCLLFGTAASSFPHSRCMHHPVLFWSSSSFVIAPTRHWENSNPP